jgi:hypothetical protein
MHVGGGGGGSKLGTYPTLEFWKQQLVVKEKEMYHILIPKIYIVFKYVCYFILNTLR